MLVCAQSSANKKWQNVTKVGRDELKLALKLFVLGGFILLVTAMVLTAGWQRPRPNVLEVGYRGTGLEQIPYPALDAVSNFAKTLPEPIPPADPTGDKAVDVYKNVKVLTDLSVDQFNRVMLSIAAWVAPEQGCAYCHNVNNLAEDSKYTKIAARRMLQMTRYINSEWKQHVANTGVTCYTCHRGNPVPAYIWFNNPPPQGTGGFAATNYGFGHPSNVNGTTEYPSDPFTPYLESKDNSEPIRIQAADALSKGYAAPIQHAGLTYDLMINISKSLGVNCDYCHNTRSLADWSQSRPQRVTAWYGIRMVRTLNTDFLNPLGGTYPEARLGPHGDAPKVYCMTCHQGVFKPLYGLSMAKDFPELGGVAASASTTTLGQN